MELLTLLNKINLSAAPKPAAAAKP